MYQFWFYLLLRFFLLLDSRCIWSVYKVKIINHYLLTEIKWIFSRSNSLVTSRGWSFRNWLFRFVSSSDSTALWHWLKFGKIPTKQNWSTSGTSQIWKVKLVTGDFNSRINIFKRRRCLHYNAIVLPTPNPVHPPPLTDVPSFEHICNIVTVEDVNDNEDDDGRKRQEWNRNRRFFNLTWNL